MNFSEALGYSLKGQNIPKILTIVLVFVILGVSIIVAGFAFESVSLLFLFVPLMIGYALFLLGYTISVIRAVMDGEEAMPAFNFGRDFGRGFMMFIASIVYWIPLGIVLACIFSVAGAGISSMAGNSGSVEDAMGGSVLTLCGVMLVSVIVGFVFNYSLIVGQIRYAMEGRAGALFDFGTNFGTVFSNLGTTFGLCFRQIGIAIIFGVVSGILGSVISGILGGAMGELSYISDAEDVLSLGMPIAIFFSAYYIVTMSINLMQSFSLAHLMAGYGIDLGLASGKSKNDDMF